MFIITYHREYKFLGSVQFLWPWTACLSSLAFFSPLSLPTHSPPIPPPSLSPSSVELRWYSVSQSWHSTSSVSPRFQLPPTPRHWLPLLDNAHPCFHLPLISGIPALLVTTGGSGRWGHRLCLACPCHSSSLDKKRLWFAVKQWKPSPPDCQEGDRQLRRQANASQIDPDFDTLI